MASKQSKENQPSDQPVRVLHLIDSLALGGAERMAVNLCNELVKEGLTAHLCATRSTGPLARSLSPSVHLLELNKRHTLDVAAFRRLRDYVLHHQIDVIHAHSSSFFLGCLIRWSTGRALVWHDHYGGNEMIKSRQALILKLVSGSFDGVLSVTQSLRHWSVEQLHIAADKIIYLPNFAHLDQSVTLQAALPGHASKRIVCTARLHPQKDHVTLIEAFSVIKKRLPDTQLLLVGEDFHDSYSSKLKKLVNQLNLESNVHFLGGRTDVAAILKASTIGVLSSVSEGLPLALLEYGLAGCAVVCTNVGECSSVLEEGGSGRITEPNDPQALANSILELLIDQSTCQSLARRFQTHVRTFFSGSATIERVIKMYTGVIK